MTEVQEETLQTIRSLVSDGLFELGDLSGEGGSLVAWSGSLDESIQRISDVYVANMTTRPPGLVCLDGTYRQGRTVSTST